MWHYIYCGGRSKRQTQWVWRQASERLLFNRNNKIVSKGDEVSKINSGSGVLVVLRGLWRRGSVLEGRVQVRGGVRWPHALPPWVRGARAAASVGGFVLLWARGASRGTARHPGPSAPFLDPRGHQRACTGKRPVSRGEAHSAYNSGSDEAPFTSGVCLITRRQTWLFQHPSSLTHPLPSEAWWRAAIKGRGVLIIRGRQPTRHNTHIYIYIYVWIKC